MVEYVTAKEFLTEADHLVTDVLGAPDLNLDDDGLPQPADRRSKRLHKVANSAWEKLRGLFPGLSKEVLWGGKADYDTAMADIRKRTRLELPCLGTKKTIIADNEKDFESKISSVISTKNTTITIDSDSDPDSRRIKGTKTVNGLFGLWLNLVRYSWRRTY